MYSVVGLTCTLKIGYCYKAKWHMLCSEADLVGYKAKWPMRCSEADLCIRWQVVWLMRRLPMSVLIQVLQLHLSHQETSLRESLVKQTTAVLERRWVELTNPKDIIYLMYTTQGGPAANRVNTQTVMMMIVVHLCSTHPMDLGSLQ